MKSTIKTIRGTVVAVGLASFCVTRRQLILKSFLGYGPRGLPHIVLGWISSGSRDAHYTGIEL